MEAFYLIFYNEGELQQVVAKSKEQAIRRMAKMYVSSWDVCCTQIEIEQLVGEELWKGLFPLPPIYVMYE